MIPVFIPIKNTNSLQGGKPKKISKKISKKIKKTTKKAKKISKKSNGK